MPAKVSPSVLAALSPPKIKNAADFANQLAYLPSSDSHPGRFRCRPYQNEILKAMSQGSRLKANGSQIKEVVLCKSAQVGYTIMILHAISYAIIYRPTAIGMYFPTNDSVLAFAGNQASKYFEAQPSLQGKISNGITSDGKSSTTRKHFDNGSLRFLSAHKPSDVATHSFGLAFVDEADLVKDIKGEGSSFDLIKNRLQEFHDSILVIGGTPRGDFNTSKTWELYNDSDSRRYMIKCPKCSRHQYLAIQQFVPGLNDYNDSGFRCINESCGYIMKEHEKRQLIKGGYWKPTNPEGQPGRAGFHISALYADSPNCSWPNLARQKEAANYDKQKIQVFVNTRLGLPCSASDLGALKAQDILDASTTSTYETVYDPATVPNDVSLITIGVDVQLGTDARLEYTTLGWSRNRCYHLNHLSIDGNTLEEEVWNTFREVAMVKYTTTDKKKTMKPMMVFVDSGAGVSTTHVYRQCKKNPRVMLPIKGNSTVGKDLVVRGYAPSTRQPLIHIQTVIAKDRLFEMIRGFVGGLPEPEIVFPSDLDPLIATGICSEYRQKKNNKNFYVHNGIDRNEALDCLVYAYAAKEHLIGPYEPESIWPSLEKRAKGIKRQNIQSINTRAQNYDSFY